jgi:hypothetical protein
MTRDSRTDARRAGKADRIVLVISHLPTLRDPQTRWGAANGGFESLGYADMRGPDMRGPDMRGPDMRGVGTGDWISMYRAARR